MHKKSSIAVDFQVNPNFSVANRGVDLHAQMRFLNYISPLRFPSVTYRHLCLGEGDRIGGKRNLIIDYEIFLKGLTDVWTTKGKCTDVCCVSLLSGSRNFNAHFLILVFLFSIWRKRIF